MLVASSSSARKSYFDPEFGTMAVKIIAGDCFATAEPVAIATVLGSCVSVCLYDRECRVGGMNHFMLPERLKRREAQFCCGACNRGLGAARCARYGSCAMGQLLQKVQLLGAHPRRLSAKLFGGGRVMGLANDIGASNAAFAVEFLNRLRIPIVASDLGECWPRKVVFFPTSGRAWVKQMRELPAGTV